MGKDKALLPFGDLTMVERVASVLVPAVDEVLLVGRRNQTLPSDFRTVFDAIEDQGPVSGLAYGFDAASPDIAFLASCDTPFLRTEFALRMIELSHGHEATVLRTNDGRLHPIGAVYSGKLLQRAQDLLSRGQRSLKALIEQSETRYVGISEVEDVDPGLTSTLSVDTPEAYENALQRAGLASGEGDS